jgi:hypothetical protein
LGGYLFESYPSGASSSLSAAQQVRQATFACL